MYSGNSGIEYHAKGTKNITLLIDPSHERFRVDDPLLPEPPVAVYPSTARTT